MVVFNRDWSEIVWFLENSCFKNGMHWIGHNDAVSWLNKVKTQIFQPTANFGKILKINLYFIFEGDNSLLQLLFVTSHK